MISFVVLTKLIDDFKSEFKIDDELVYKKCLQTYIIVMKKLHDTITNESRTSVVNRDYAKFRANRLEVLLIINLVNGSISEQSVTNRFSDKTVCYTVGSIVKPDRFDTDLDSVCSSGIHYFRSLERTYYYNIITNYYNIVTNEDNFDGQLKQWGDDGGLCKQCTYIKGKCNGLCEEWHMNGKLSSRCNYADGNKDGLYEGWHSNRALSIKCNYTNGKINGLCECWYSNGQPNYRYNYVDNKKNGLCESWNIDGTVHFKRNYVDDKIVEPSEQSTTKATTSGRLSSTVCNDWRYGALACAGLLTAIVYLHY